MFCRGNGSVGRQVVYLAMQVRPVAGDKDDRTSCRYKGKCGVHKGELGVPIDTHRVLRVGSDKVAFQSASSVEHQEVKVITPLPQLSEQMGNVLLLCDITGHSEGTHTALCHLSSNLAGPCLFVAVSDSHVVAAIGKGEGCCCSNTTRTACDECYRVFILVHHMNDLLDGRPKLFPPHSICTGRFFRLTVCGEGERSLGGTPQPPPRGPPPGPPSPPTETV